MIDDPIHIVTGGDLRFLSGVQVTLSSALIGIPEEASVVVHILDGGLGNDARNNLQELAQRCHRQVQIVFHVVPKSSLEAFAPGPGNSRMYYARIGMASLMNDVKRVIYLDSDTLVLADLSQLWGTDSKGAIVMACKDRKVSKLSEDSPWPLSPEEANLPYFNSGVMLVDLNQWRSEQIEKQCLDLITRPSGLYSWWDQTILNHLLRGRIQFLSQEWNWQSEEEPDSDTPPRVLHYTTGLKPWVYWGSAFRFKAWRKCYKAYVGSPARLFLKNGSWRGFINGLFDGLLDNSPPIRGLYLSYLKVSHKLSGSKERASLLDQKIRFLNSPHESRDRKNEEQLLKEFNRRIAARVR
jgi:lipopolysaccharide biosynthesis glycosyltransferase